MKSISELAIGKQWDIGERHHSSDALRKARGCAGGSGRPCRIGTNGESCFQTGKEGDQQ